LAGDLHPTDIGFSSLQLPLQPASDSLLSNRLLLYKADMVAAFLFLMSLSPQKIRFNAGFRHIGYDGKQ
jgi:hypothetical protein